jgi:hypothetical protein
MVFCGHGNELSVAFLKMVGIAVKFSRIIRFCEVRFRGFRLN